MIADISGQYIQVSITNKFSHVSCTHVYVILVSDINVAHSYKTSGPYCELYDTHVVSN